MANPEGVTPEQAAISEINATHLYIKGAEKGLYNHYVRVGSLLHGFKKAEGHGNWATWLATNCPDISERTARVYMQLAMPKAQEKVAAAAAAKRQTTADLTAQDALEMLRPPKTEEQKLKAKEARETKKKQEKGENFPSEPTGKSLKDYLLSLDATQFISMVKETYTDQDYINTVVEGLAPRPSFQEWLNTHNPQEIIESFDPEVWEAEDLETMGQGLIAKAAKLREQEASPAQPKPSGVRRPITEGINNL